ncbi:serine protease [Dinochytrium kinnereticum]|nr:serine protease [Dinochytrium kinnereticum]
MLFTTLKSIAVLLLAGSAAALPSSHRHHRKPSTSSHFAPLLKTTGKAIKDKYIVVLKEGMDEGAMVGHYLWLAETLTMANAFSEEVLDVLDRTFDVGGNGVFRGYSGTFSLQTLALLRANPMVAHVEQDQIISVDYHKESVRVSEGLVTQKDAPWGLARISHKDLPKDAEKQSEYIFKEDVGEGVTAYVIDTGVYVAHSDFEGRAKWGITIPKGDQDIDGNGHGTHVAGTIAGKRYGVAKNAKIVAVKVLRSNGSGTLSDVIKGVEWVVGRHLAEVAAAEARGKSSKVKSVANMSLGGGSSPGLDRAVNVAVESGIHFAVAAGNSGDDACDYSPAASELAVTVGATTSADTMAYFSNHGRCTDIYGPGYNILSTWIGSPNATATISGTSMASPHTAGVLAALASFNDFETYSPADLKKHLIEKLAHKDVVKGIPNWAGGDNRLLFLEENSVDAPEEEEEEEEEDEKVFKGNNKAQAVFW